MQKTERASFNPGWLLLAGFASGFLLIRRFPALLTMPCPLKTTLHIPCPACGTSRSITALGHFDIATAFWLNPLFFVVLIASLAIIANTFLQAITGYRVEIARVPSKSRFAVMLLLILNQLYLLAAGL